MYQSEFPVTVTHSQGQSYTFSYIYQNQSFCSFKHHRYTSSEFFAQLFFQKSYLAIHSYAFPNHAAVTVIYNFRKPKAKIFTKPCWKYYRSNILMKYFHFSSAQKLSKYRVLKYYIQYFELQKWFKSQVNILRNNYK